MAKETISAGAAIINDIAAGGLDSEEKVVGALKVPIYYDAYERKSQYYATTCLVFRFDTGGIRIFFS